MAKLKIYLKNILIPLILGTIIGLITSKTMNYNELIKPVLAPPGFIFPIVWTILYILMGISYAILKINGRDNKISKSTYILQLTFNLIWPIIFFTFNWRGVALIWIILLLFFVINMIYQFYKEEKIAGLLQIPYLLWVSFATYLNLFFFILNR